MNLLSRFDDKIRSADKSIPEDLLTKQFLEDEQLARGLAEMDQQEEERRQREKKIAEETKNDAAIAKLLVEDTPDSSRILRDKQIAADEQLARKLNHLETSYVDEVPLYNKYKPSVGAVLNVFSGRDMSYDIERAFSDSGLVCVSMEPLFCKDLLGLFTRSCTRFRLRTRHISGPETRHCLCLCQWRRTKSCCLLGRHWKPIRHH
ncbi:hypothetical protein Pelo_15748 [Pelomyxa schiedti]|nr:hypothetical protein Pelo_15748 [Pelomyxa schiedti]